MHVGDIDVLEAFGPLASMHAALDRVGIGMPCGFVARLKETNLSAAEAAVSRARRLFPILDRQLLWVDGRPVLRPLTPQSNLSSAIEDLILDFQTAPDRPYWGYNLVQHGKDVWLMAVWGHAAADGLSMLRFLAAVEGCGVVGHADRNRRALVRSREAVSFSLWLARFIQERLRSHLRFPSDSSEQGVAWTTIPPAEANEHLHRAQSFRCGFASWLGAASCIALCELPAVARTGRVLLNIPIARTRPDFYNEFGFGIGSLLLPVRVKAGDRVPDLAKTINRGLVGLAAAGADGHLERFLGRNPARHLFFAKQRARQAPDPTINISWKGVHTHLGGPGGVKDIACFGVSPTAHLSAHVDANGMSISLTSPQRPSERLRLLQGVLIRLEQTAPSPIMELKTLNAPPLIADT